MSASRPALPRGRSAAALAALLFLALPALGADDKDAPRPNIVWLTSEDHGPHMGCYGDTFATTPNVDALAARGLTFTRVWSNAPVCAPARTTIISGLYPPSTGSEHMRSLVPFPKDKKMYPQYLRDAGYYCTNNSKEDYNLAKPGQVWDESSAKAHWRNRKAGQPFFAVFNSTKSHESQVRARPHTPVHDPAKVKLPAYHPDTPETRRDWAQYYDVVSRADADAGARLKELADAGLAGDTIVFYYADHGPGLPRGKRSACHSGLRVPLVVHIPEKFKHLAPPEYKPGGTSDRLVGFVDLAPTVLALAGVKVPEWMQGKPFLGPAPARNEFLFGFRGRMDERPDLVRSATDGRFVYVRNYMPHKPPGQHVQYMFEMPTARVWKELFDAGKLKPEQTAFWKPKPAEELYDLATDPDEVVNLAADPAHAATLAKLRKAQQDLAAEIRDVGFLPEGEFFSRFGGASPYDGARTGGAYPFERIFAAAELAARLTPDGVPALRALFKDDDSAVRYWAAMGVLIRGEAAVRAAGEELRAALKDRSPDVRIAAAEALARYGDAADQKAALDALIDLASCEAHGAFTAVAALNALDAAGDAAKPHADAIRKLPTKCKTPDARYDSYVPRLVADVPAKWK
ncbi:sulfatase : Probable sulfatase atsG OS=Planctomyces maris DSM 8797 GN=PM8797T_00507 PE=4 SV=1: Sulfatase: Sulfatase [Gemmataceae bacterium]|nr:sulfatase : Probable sulfatase atsG OS=Planctomyces maris DSM 8797 GN=PM8797T_00507 PE=4 SV=1: Sulfatase: Sulfatase [Gemmataceae bacterium]VTU00969.1 sulfatase : Probable sulfatase atsG OS=Planctomyces maris DSM 8797 GN=PM8797T_00507 PE=4 SV=1: Sulfatase: Sulfatase [Gemmataceae bacterium]